MRQVVNAMLYVLHEGCRWRALPHDSAAWETVYWYFAKWTQDGAIRRLHDTLRRRVLEHTGRGPEPTAIIIYNQSVNMKQ